MADSFEEIKLKAEELKKTKKFSDAVILYEKLWNEYRPNCGKWEGWGLAYCYKNLKRYNDALPICREVFAIDKNFELNNNVYAWSVYYAEIKKPTDDDVDNEKQFLKAANAVMDLVPQGKFTARAKTALEVIKHFKNKTNKNFENMLDWCSKIDVTTLSTECFKYKDDDGQDRELASDKERWYSAKSFILINTKRYQECVELCNEALAKIPKFHYGNDLWFKMRIVLCEWKLGHKDESKINMLKEILAQRKEWFLQYDLAEFFHEIGKNDEAMKYALDSALNFGDPDKKGKVYMMLANLLKTTGNTELAGKHALLSYSFIQSEKRKNSDQTKAMLKNFGVSMPTNIDSRVLLSELKNEWNKLKSEFNEAHSGTITKYITKESGREFGFIKDSETGKELYFRAKTFKGDRRNIKQGLKVKYFTEENFDHKKNCKSEMAINVEEAK